jgi:hypothetical protein
MSSRVTDPPDTDGPRSSSGSRDRDRDMRTSTRSDDSMGSVRGSSNQKTLKFFRNMIGQKHNDYHSDAPPPVQQQQSAASLPTSRGPSNRSLGGLGGLASLRGVGGGGGGEGGHPTGSGPAGLWSRCCRWLSCSRLSWPADRRRFFMSNMIQSKVWKLILIVFTFLLLFGPQIREMFLPKGWDDFMDYLFLVAFVFFTADILIRIDVEPNYFSFDLFCLRQSKGAQASSNLGGSGWSGCGSCGLGSFLFWCDVVSTLTLLHEISFINKKNFDEVQINIRLNPFGIPVRTHGSSVCSCCCCCCCCCCCLKRVPHRLPVCGLLLLCCRRVV